MAITCGNQVVWVRRRAGDMIDPRSIYNPRVEIPVTPPERTCFICGVELDGDPIVIKGKEYCGKCGRRW